MYATFVLACLALLAHQVFRRYETYKISVHALLLLVPPALVTGSHLPALSSELYLRSFLRSCATYYSVLILSVLAYRISPLHPLASYPGPLLSWPSMFYHAFVTITGKQHRYLQSLHERYGDIVRIGPNEVSIRDPSVISTLMGPAGVGKGHNFVGAMLCEAQVPMVGIPDMDEHLRRRRAWNRGLGPAALKEYEHLVTKRARQLVRRLGEQKGEVILGQWFNGFSYDFMCDMAFGGGSEILEDGDQGNVWKVIEEGVVPATFLSQVPWLGIYIGYIPIAVKSLNTFLMHGRTFAIKRLERGSTTRDLFHYLNNEDLPERSPPPMNHLVDDGILAIVAGSDTASSALTSLFACLLTHPETYAKLQQEVDKYYPQGEDPYNAKHYRDMTYLHAVINEALRLFPPVMTSSPRKVPHNAHGVHAGSLYLPPGTSIRIPPWSLHHDARNFTSPYSFWPERWLIASQQVSLEDAPPPPPPARVSPPDPARLSSTSPAAIDSKGAFTHNETAFMAFSYGPMGCVGKGLAMQELRTVVCALMQQYEFALRDGWDPSEYGLKYKDFFVATRPDVPVRLTRRW